MTIKRLSKLLFYALIFLIPSNLAKHWPQNWSYVNGILIDYLIPTLYLTDILIGLLLIFWLISSILSFPRKRESIKTSLFTYLNRFRVKPGMTRNRNFIVFFIILLSISYQLSAKNSPAALYKLIKLVEFSLLILWIKTHINIKNDIKTIINVLSLSVIWQSVLAMAQWFNQGSIFGYWFYGEQPYNTANLGIKFVNFFGHLKIPPYGTFPHPNVLAGFLVIGLTFIIFNFQFSIFNQFSNLKLSNIKNSLKIINYKLKILSLLITLILGSIALFLTFSYPAWITVVFSIWYLVFRKIKFRTQYTKYQILHTKYLFLAFCFLLLAVILFFWFHTNEPTSFTRRFDLTLIALRMWLSSLIFGVGLNNFIPRMEEFGQVVSNTRFLQPVHNIYLLWLAETGIVGTWIMGYALWRLWRLWIMNHGSWIMIKKHSKHIIYPFIHYPLSIYPLLIIFFLGLFDHYFLTIQQGNLILALVLGICLQTHQFLPNKLKN